MTQAIKAPFVMEFGGTVVEEKGDWLYCEEKNVKILKSLLTTAIKQVGKHPIGIKFLVGIQIRGNTHTHLWRDEFYTYIGCLSEKTTTFNKKYLQFIKHLNNR